MVHSSLTGTEGYAYSFHLPDYSNCDVSLKSRKEEQLTKKTIITLPF